MQTLGNFYYNIIDSRTGEWVTYEKTTVGHDGVVISTLNESTYIDGVLYIKLKPAFGTGYAKRIVPNAEVNIRSFDVIGNGVANDREAIDKALASCANCGYILLLTKGVYNLKGEIVNIPANTKIKSLGGYFKNGTLNGNQTTIISDSLYQIFDTDVKFTGTWVSDTLSDINFGAISGATSFIDNCTLGEVRAGNINAKQFKVSDLNTAPANATDTGTKGEIRITATHIYVCVATNSWVRSELLPW
jgi:hypothetical protein